MVHMGSSSRRRAPRMVWGYAAGLPGNTATAWGCRAIVNQAGLVDVLADRVSSYGPHIKTLNKRLMAGGQQAWVEAARRLLTDGTLVVSEDREHVLYEDDDIVIKCNTLGSGEYLHVCAYPKVRGRSRTPRRATERPLEEQYTALRHKMLAAANLLQYTRSYGKPDGSGTYRYRDEVIARRSTPAAPFGAELSAVGWVMKYSLAEHDQPGGEATLANAYTARPVRRTREGDRVLAVWTAKHGNPLAAMG